MSYFLQPIYKMIEEEKINNEDSLKKFFLTDDKWEFILDKKWFPKEDPNILKYSFLTKDERGVSFMEYIQDVKDFKRNLFWDNLWSAFTTYKIEQEWKWDWDKELIIVRWERDYSRIFQNILIILIYLIMMPYLIIKWLFSVIGFFSDNDSMWALYLMIFSWFIAYYWEEIWNWLANFTHLMIEANKWMDMIASM